MIAKVRQKEEAIRLRKKGCSYRNILKEVPVAKSSLSRWLSELPLTNKEQKYLRTRNNANISRGRIKAATALRERRIERERLLFEESKEEFKEFVKDPFFHTGVALYWAEGAKRNNCFAFSNSDPEMVNIMTQWIEKFFGIKRLEIRIRIYAHKAYAHENIEKFWSEKLDIPLKNFKRTILKPSNFSFRKRPGYKGCIRVELPQGLRHLRKTVFWKNMIVEYYCKQ